MKQGDPTPWGRADVVETIADGIWNVDASTHGGIKLDRSRQRQMPAEMRLPGGWYEEDDAYVFPVAVFEEAFRSHYLALGFSGEEVDRHIAVAMETFRHYHPDGYEAFTGQTLAPGQSRVKDERAFYRRHANDWLAISAIQDSALGGTRVTATLGGVRDSDAEHRQYLVDGREYEKSQRRQAAFVIDPARHQRLDGQHSQAAPERGESSQGMTPG